MGDPDFNNSKMWSYIARWMRRALPRLRGPVATIVATAVPTLHRTAQSVAQSVAGNDVKMAGNDSDAHYGACIARCTGHQRCREHVMSN